MPDKAADLFEFYTVPWGDRFLDRNGVSWYKANDTEARRPAGSAGRVELSKQVPPDELVRIPGYIPRLGDRVETLPHGVGTVTGFERLGKTTVTIVERWAPGYRVRVELDNPEHGPGFDSPFYAARELAPLPAIMERGQCPISARREFVSAGLFIWIPQRLVRPGFGTQPMWYDMSGAPRTFLDAGPAIRWGRGQLEPDSPYYLPLDE